MSEIKDRMVARIESWRGTDVQQPNWCSYRSDPVTTKTIDAAIEVAKQIAGVRISGFEITTVVPTGDGGVEFSDADENIWIQVTTYEEVSE
jgi:membrane-anchored protein YejM (alkaline phosphatase superfamily)